MNAKRSLIPVAILLSFCVENFAQSIDRGPYLQSVKSTSIYIHWRTDSATDSKVWYGTDPNNLDLTLTSNTNITDHKMLVPSLTPNTVYYYAVGDSNGQMAGGDVNHYFKTTPNQDQLIRTWILGDAGTAGDDQRAVRDAYYDFVGDDHIDMILLLGDNAYGDGTQEEYQQSWFVNMYEDRLINSVMWSTFGNHDGNSADSETQTGPYYDIFNFPKNGQIGGVASFTEAYYSFDYGNIHVISLNSHDVDDSETSPMIQWLEDDVNANTKDFMIALFHHPAYSGSTTSMQTNALPILEDGGCDLVIVGHHHRYERSWLINGHYGPPDTFDESTMTIDGGDGRTDGDGEYVKNIGGPGTIYMTAGSSGKVNGGSSDHPIMYTTINLLGSVDIQVNGIQMDVQFIDHNGDIGDYFTIKKQDGPPVISITNPQDNDFFPVPENINITADASDNGSVADVEFFIDDNSIGTDFNAPYSMNWLPPGNGEFVIKATATDNENNKTSKSITINVGDGTVCVKVDSSNDDAEEDNAGGMSITSGDLELIQESSDQIVGMRFTDMNIPHEATINSAFIQFTVDKNTNINPCDLTIYAEDIDDAPQFQNNNNNISSRTKTTASVVWSPPDWDTNGESGPDQKTVDISPVLQEVVDRPGYTSSSAIAIIVEGTGKREAESFNGTAVGAPELCVEFSVAPLPIELLDFKAKTVDDEVLLEWSTVSETNNDYFVLERSFDAFNFMELGTVPGHGSTDEMNRYGFMDKNPQDGLNYYRLKQIDFDGKFTYSDIVNASIKSEKRFRIYPSKVKNVLIVEKGHKMAEDLTITVHDLTGKKYRSFYFPFNENRMELPLTDLMQGSYFLSLKNNSINHSFKFIKL